MVTEKTLSINNEMITILKNSNIKLEQLASYTDDILTFKIINTEMPLMDQYELLSLVSLYISDRINIRLEISQNDDLTYSYSYTRMNMDNIVDYKFSSGLKYCDNRVAIIDGVLDILKIF